MELFFGSCRQPKEMEDTTSTNTPIMELFCGLGYRMHPSSECRAWEIDFQEFLPSLVQERSVPPVALVLLSEIPYENA